MDGWPITWLVRLFARIGRRRRGPVATADCWALVRADGSRAWLAIDRGANRRKA